MTTTKPRIASLVAVIALLVIGLLAVPAAADKRHLIVTLLGGRQVSLTVDAAPGTPVGSIPLPDLGSPVVSVAELPGAPTPPPPPATTAAPVTTAAPATSAASATTTSPGPPKTIPTATATTPTTVTTPAASTTTPSAIGTVVVPKGKVKPQGSAEAVPSVTTPTGEAAHGVVEDTAPAPPPTAAQPTPASPGFTIAPTGAAPIGVPSFFIDQFRIPPFLLPIYQAAGIEYSVPWQVLAAINEIETDYGRNLNVSSAGALGWMQFMPSSWAMYGVDANGDDVRDPYNPVDAIFAAARYLKAAGADVDLARAIFAYNHADWYVQSVLLRARVIGGMPADLVGSLTGLTQGRFPVAARATYADGLSAAAATRRVRGTNAAVPVEGDPARRSINVFAKRGAPAIAVNDGRIAKLGRNAKLGRFIVLQDVYGNRYTYAHLGRVARKYPVPKPRRAAAAARIDHELELPKADAKPTAPASAGRQQRAGGAPVTLAATRKARRQLRRARLAAARAVPVRKQRLFAHPSRPAAYRNGGRRQLEAIGEQMTTVDGYFTGALQVNPRDYLLKPMHRGASVIAGTVLGRVGATDPQLAPHLEFAIRPAGRGAPHIDPKPILDGWKLLESTAIYRAKGTSPFFGRDATHPSIGQVLLMSKEELQQRVLADPDVTIYDCGRKDIETGAIDRRVLATIELLSASGLRPTITALECGHSYYTSSGNVSEHSSGNAVDIAAINGIPITGHQGEGSITDLTIRRLMTLQGALKPHQIISLMTYPGTDNTYAMADHSDHIHVGFQPIGTGLVGLRMRAVLKPVQWTKLLERLSTIENPVVPRHPSKYAIKDGRSD